MNKPLKIAGAVVVIVVVASVAILLINGLTLPGGNSTDTTPPENENAVVNITYGKGATCPVGELYVDVHIKNNGYANFQPLGSKFELTMNGVVYNYWYSGSQLLGWRNTDIADGESYDASIAFQVPDSTAPFTLSYVDTSAGFNVTCQPE